MLPLRKFWLLATFSLLWACSNAVTEQKTTPQEATVTADAPGRWSAQRANDWYDDQGWMVGCDFIPSNAINQLEMWQEATFSPELIDQELGYAESLGFNAVRVYLHHLAWQQDRAGFKQWIADLKPYGRPILCTEYMARTRNSTFATILPLLKAENISAFNWGLVSGKTNTIYAWNTPIADSSEPPVWFHDIFRPGGEPYSQEEVQVIRQETGVTQTQQR